MLDDEDSFIKVIFAYFSLLYYSTSSIYSFIWPLVSGKNPYMLKQIAAIIVKQIIGFRSYLWSKLSRAGLMTSENPPKSQRIEEAARTFQGKSQLEQISTKAYKELMLKRKTNNKMISKIAYQQNEQFQLLKNISPMEAVAMAKERMRLADLRFRLPISLQAGKQTVKSAMARIVPTRQGLKLKLSTNIEEPQKSVRTIKSIIKQQKEILRNEPYLHKISTLTFFPYSTILSLYQLI